MSTTTVAEFRNTTDHLFQLSRDFHACVDSAERLSWVRRVTTVLEGSESQACKRARLADHEQRLAAIRGLRAIMEKVS